VQLAIRVGVLFLRERLQQAAVRFVTPSPLRNLHPAGTVMGCRGAARDIMALALAGHNTLDRTLWRTRFGRAYGPVVRQTT